MNLQLNSEYWNDKYLNHDFEWDIGYVSTPLKNYIDILTDKNLKILIPGDELTKNEKPGNNKTKKAAPNATLHTRQAM